MRPSRRSPGPPLVVAGLVLTLLLWLGEAAGFGVSRALSVVAVLASLALVGWLVGVRVLRALRSDQPETRTAAWTLFLLVLASFALRFVGLDYELTSHFHNDEGTFLANARSIQDGQLLPVRFHYPHLLYYLSAFVLWLEALFPRVAALLAQGIFGVAAEETSVLLLRMLTATLSALTTVPVFLAARSLVGVRAAALAGALIAVSPVYNEVSHLAISDVPSGLFAAIVFLYVAYLTRGERLSHYLAAGVAAGLAAASKYPAGLCAIAIVGVWLYWRVRRRDFNAHLVWSGGVSLLTLLAVMPALWLRADAVFQGPGSSDILFGYRQYALHGWVGVVVESNAAYYLGRLADAFGYAALGLGSMGLVLLPPEARRRAFMLLPFPLVYGGMLLAMNVVVKRNLQPLLPALAVLLGVGLSSWLLLVRRKFRAPALAAVLGVLVVAGPAFRALAWDISRTRPGTSQLAVEWIETNLPQGSGVLKEAYTPDLDTRRYAVQQSRYVARLSLDEILDPRWDYVFLARNAHLRFLGDSELLKPHQKEFPARYARLFDLELARRFEPGRFRAGPDLLLYRVDPEPLTFVDQRTFRAREATYLSHPSLEASSPDGLRFSRKGLSAVFKEYFEAGSYSVSINRQPEGVQGWLLVTTRDNEQVAEIEIQGATALDLPRRSKYLFRVFLSAGGVLRRLEIASAESG